MINKRKRWVRIGTTMAVALGGYAVIGLSPWSDTTTQETDVAGIGSANNLQTTYEEWSKGYAATNPAGPVLTLQWTRGLSQDFSEAKGIAQLNIEKGTVSVRIDGLSDTDITDVWMVDNLPGEGRTVIPESGDNMVKIGDLTFEDGYAWLDAKVENLANFNLDMMVLARHDGEPGKDGVLFGTTSLFQKVYHYPDRNNPWEPSDGGSFELVSSAIASGITPDGFFPDFDSDLLNEGRRLFFDETFEGNGRSCGTCHLENDNLALSLESIAALPAHDPLFIVEQEYRLDGSLNALFNEFRMEQPALMRKVGLIVENLDGFRDEDGDFTENFVMRAPNHVLSVRTTLAPPPAVAFDDGTLPVDPNDLVFEERTGWGGDGTPTGFRADFFESNGRDLTGSLRDFVIGAIVQHYPLTLERSAFDTDDAGNPREPDFRFATELELDAIEAFMLSVGVQSESDRDDLNNITLLDEVADRGRLNYMGFNVFDADPGDGRDALNCNACHFNGGGNTNPTFAFPPAVTPNHDLADLAANGGSIPSHNRSFGPAVERLVDQAGDIIMQTVDDPSVAGNCFSDGLAAVPLLPGDVSGTPSAGCDRNGFDNGFGFGFDETFGDLRAATDRFNAPPVFEAADNPPFFHAHQINTIEGAVAFYTSGRHFRNGDFAGAIVPMNGAQVANVARFIRVMGADFNISSAIQLSQKALQLRRFRDRRTNARLAFAEAEDALELLTPVSLHITDGQPTLERAISRLRSASFSGSRFRLRQAISQLQLAQDAMVYRD